MSPDDRMSADEKGLYEGLQAAMDEFAQLWEEAKADAWAMERTRAEIRALPEVQR